VKKQVKKVKNRTKAASIPNQTFELLMARFDTVDADNLRIENSFKSHIEQSDKVNAVVSRHSTFWGIFAYGLLGVGGLIASAVGAWFTKLIG
jgi:hypothetical protein